MPRKSVPYTYMFLWGIFHGADIAYTFGFPLLMPKDFTTTAEISFSKEMMTIWANFAKTGSVYI